jgi:hypothetical protein
VEDCVVLKLAIKAGLPLITVVTDDVVNAGAVITAVAGQKAQPYQPNLKPKIEQGQLYYITDSAKLDLKVQNQLFSQRGSTLVVVNPTEDTSAAFDAGVLIAPPSMIKKFIEKYGDDEHHDGLMAAMAGLSFEQVFQVSKLAMTKHGVYTPRAVRDIRRTFFGTVRGLQMLPTDFLYYKPDEGLTEWLTDSGRFLTEFDEPLLTPRGLIFTGPPGTGKTMGSKFLARSLDLPLYHLDIAGLMEKYVGESEQNLRIALKQAEQSAPCIMLIDEVEKLFSTGNDDTGVTSRMLSTILWWLQEHKSKVFTIMTTNKETAIPPELYRAGRIDSEIKFTTMPLQVAWSFEKELRKRMGLVLELEIPEVDYKSYGKTQVSHADVTQAVLRSAKLAYLTKEG